MAAIRLQEWNGRKNAIIRARGALADRLLVLDHIRVDHKPARILEFVEVVKCYRCAQ